jgi:hypothetical protein
MITFAAHGRKAMKIISTIALSIFAAAATTMLAAAQSSPVVTACQSDIAQLCAGKPNDGEVRACFEQNYVKVLAACQKALDNTGAGPGPGLGPRH